MQFLLGMYNNLFVDLDDARHPTAPIAAHFVLGLLLTAARVPNASVDAVGDHTRRLCPADARRRSRTSKGPGKPSSRDRSLPLAPFGGYQRRHWRSLAMQSSKRRTAQPAPRP